MMNLSSLSRACTISCLGFACLVIVTALGFAWVGVGVMGVCVFGSFYCDIKNAVNDLDKNANEMLSVAGTTANESQMVIQSSQDTSMNVQTISAATEEMSATIAEISQQVTRTSDIAQNAEGETKQCIP